MSEPPVQPTTPAVPSDRPGPDPTADPHQELEQLGTRLREARLRHGLSIEHLSERLHIGLHQLQALENADRARLPEVVFVIAQAKRVAEVLEVDVDDLIPRLRQAKAQRNPPRPENSPPPRPLRPLPAKPKGSSRATSRSFSPLQAPVPLVLALAGVAALAVAALRPRPTTNPAPAPIVGAPSTPRPGAAPVRAAEEVLVLRAAEPSWMEVRSPGGQRLFEGTLEGERRFPLGAGLEVRAGRPYAVTAAVGSRPPRPLGKVDDIAWKRFSPAGIGAAGEPPIRSDRPAPAP